MPALTKKASVVVFFLIITLATIYYRNLQTVKTSLGNKVVFQVVKKYFIHGNVTRSDKHELTKDVGLEVAKKKSVQENATKSDKHELTKDVGLEVAKKKSVQENATKSDKHELTKVDVLEQNLLWMQRVTDPQYDLEEVRKTQVERLSLVNKYCLNHTSPGLGKRAGGLYFLTFRNVSWGLIPKTGSTNILRMVCIMIGPKCTNITGYPDEHHYVPWLMGSTPNLGSYSPNSSDWPTRKFLYAFVRDPWQRLVSTYIEKVLFSDLYIKLCKYGNNINFVNFSRNLKKENKTMTYSQFLKYCVIEQYEKRGAIAMEPHYRPQSVSGAFCDLSYSFIGKTETYGEDIKVVLQQYNVKDVPAIIAKAKQFRRPNEKKNMTLSSYLDRWKSVDQETIMKLQKIYSVDIEMFGYPRQPY